MTEGTWPHGMGPTTDIVCVCVCIQCVDSGKQWSSERPADSAAGKDEDVMDADSTAAASSSASPLPLMHACRRRLRRHLVNAGRVVGLLSAVAYLPLPPTLQRFLLLDELDTVH